MATNTVQMIYIGNLPIIDNDESDWDTDNHDALIGTYDDLKMVAITNHDVDNDGIIYDDEGGTGDYVSYDTGNGPVSSGQDAIISYFAIITERDGTQHNVEVTVVQMPNGDTFVNDFGEDGVTDNLNIDSIQLYQPGITNASGRYATDSTENTTVCFLKGTLIDTADGPRPVEDLQSGDLVMTRDDGLQPLRWVHGAWMERPGRNAPIEISAGALGPGCPATTLCVSPQHRMLIASPIVQRMFGVREVLVAAKHLLWMQGVRQLLGTRPVSYWHIAFDRHHVVQANGTPSETFFPGPEALKMLSRKARADLSCALGQEDLSQIAPARLFPAPREQEALILRHLKNGQPLLKAKSGLGIAQHNDQCGRLCALPNCA